MLGLRSNFEQRMGLGILLTDILDKEMNLVIVNVSDLRRELEGMNLELDGSRKVLIERLESHRGYVEISDDDVTSSSNSWMTL